MPRMALGVDEGIFRLPLELRKRLFAAHYNKRRYIVPYDEYYYMSNKLCIKQLCMTFFFQFNYPRQHLLHLLETQIKNMLSFARKCNLLLMTKLREYVN